MDSSLTFPSPPPLLFFPMAAAVAAAAAATVVAAAAADQRFHVLVVDDSPTDRKLAERLLKNSSYRVTAVDSVSRALEFLGLFDHQGSSTAMISREIDVSLIVTDYSMPGMTGYDLLKKIKESSMLKDIPVVIMSSENLPSRINRCLEEGADEFFLKPVQLSDMQKLRPHILKGKSQESSSRSKFSNDNVLPEWTRIRLHPLAV